MWPFRNKYDAFISHAVEDKLPIANDLCAKLEEAGLKIWYSGKELTVGDSVEKAIHKGLDQSKYGVVILSPTYLKKNWTKREFYTLLGKEINSRKVILPVLYNITPEDLVSHDLTMADRYGLAVDKGLDYVAEKLVAAIKLRQPMVTRAKMLFISLSAILAITFSLFSLKSSFHSGPQASLTEAVIEKRIADLQQAFDQQFQAMLEKGQYNPVSTDSISQHYTAFRNYQSYYRNEYEFTNGINTLRFKKNIEPVLNIDFDALSPANNYNFSSPQIYLSTSTGTMQNKVIQYVYVNTQPITYTIKDEAKIGENQYLITAIFDNNVRYCWVSLQYPSGPGMPKRSQIQVRGLLPVEEFRLRRDGQDWKLVAKQF